MAKAFKFFFGSMLLVMWLPTTAFTTEAKKKEQHKEKAEKVVDKSPQQHADDYDLDPKKWGIQNGCIHTNRIRKMTFVDNQSAIIKISNKKFILMTLTRPCPGVKNRGVSYQSRNGMLCERHDYIKSLDTGFNCQIKSFEPYVVLEDEADEFVIEKLTIEE